MSSFSPPSRANRRPLAAWLRRHGNLAALLMGLLLSAIALAAFEGAFYWLNAGGGPRRGMRDLRQPNYRQGDAILGMKPAPDLKARHAKFYEGETLFDVTYAFDAFSRRATPVADAAQPQRKALLFFGCSFTFGTGVEDGDTLPAQAGRVLPDWRVYNYAFQGYGPQHMTAKLEAGALPEEIEEDKAFLFYVFIPDHIRRVIGSRKVVCGWAYGADFPYYDYDESGALRRFGSFATGRPWRQRVYGLLHREQCMKYFEMDWPPRVGARHMRLTADVIRRGFDLFAEEYGPGRARVLLYPGDVRYSERSMSGRAFIPYLEAAGLPYLDCTDAFDLGEAGYAIPHDGHPTAKAHAIVAERVAEYLRAAAPQP